MLLEPFHHSKFLCWLRSAPSLSIGLFGWPLLEVCVCISVSEEPAQQQQTGNWMRSLLDYRIIERFELEGTLKII